MNVWVVIKTESEEDAIHTHLIGIFKTKEEIENLLEDMGCYKNRWGAWEEYFGCHIDILEIPMGVWNNRGYWNFSSES